MASEKATTAKKLAEDQLQKTQDAISGATSGVKGLAGGLVDDTKKGTQDIKDKAGRIEIDVEFIWLLMRTLSGDSIDDAKKGAQNIQKRAGKINFAFSQ